MSDWVPSNNNISGLGHGSLYTRSQAGGWVACATGFTDVFHDWNREQ